MLNTTDSLLRSGTDPIAVRDARGDRAPLLETVAAIAVAHFGGTPTITVRER
jgi:hypothetical protein